MMVVLVSSTALAYNPTHSLHGSRASFLMQDSRWMTLNYLHPNANKVGIINAAKAIMTTDTYPKVAVETVKIKDKKIRIYGIAKGSGMIAPNMGTMLSYLFIEASLSSKALDKLTNARDKLDTLE